jgi:hypothetical protein
LIATADDATEKGSANLEESFMSKEAAQNQAAAVICVRTLIRVWSGLSPDVQDDLREQLFPYIVFDYPGMTPQLREPIGSRPDEQTTPRADGSGDEVAYFSTSVRRTRALAQRFITFTKTAADVASEISGKSTLKNRWLCTGFRPQPVSMKLSIVMKRKFRDRAVKA